MALDLVRHAEVVVVADTGYVEKVMVQGFAREVP